MRTENAPPGRLGQPHLVLRNDPRADPRVVAAMEKVGMAGGMPASPVDAGSPLDVIRAMVAETEPAVESFRRDLYDGLQPVQGVTSTREVVQGVDGNDISVFIHRPTVGDARLPAIVHFHGGAMAMLEAAGPSYVRWRDELAATGLVVVGVEFRNSAGKLGPFPFPAGLNDGYSALQWTHDNRKRLGISKIIVSGESGGGNLTLATALKAKRDGGVNMVDGVYAQSPAISNGLDRQSAAFPSVEENDGYGIERRGSGAMMKLYDPDGENARNPLAWPSCASEDDLRGLPPHVITVNELDPLRDEGLAYYRRLMRAGVAATSRTFNGTTHAAECLFRRELPDVYHSAVNDIKAFADFVSSQDSK
jgi:acetyl esterase/lipase